MDGWIITLIILLHFTCGFVCAVAVSVELDELEISKALRNLIFLYGYFSVLIITGFIASEIIDKLIKITASKFEKRVK